QTRIVLGTALAVGAAVAVSGAIGFVGLVVPHLLRPWVAYRPGRLLLPSALGGAILLLVADMGVRLLPTTSELRIGVVTAIIGAPFFLALIVESRRAPA
ncbi:MAG: iron chelate uptake ABC transporter family permease subunit, partial [Alphaproteobacteria bacterium]